MKEKLLDLWYDTRPFFGHALIGIAAGILVVIAIITVFVFVSQPFGVAFLILSNWVLWLFAGAAACGALGIGLYMAPYDRKEWHARHALRPVGASKPSSSRTTPTHP